MANPYKVWLIVQSGSPRAPITPTRVAPEQQNVKIAPVIPKVTNALLGLLLPISSFMAVPPSYVTIRLL